MLDVQAIQTMLEEHVDAVDGALGAEAPGFWGEVAAIMQSFAAAGDERAQAEAAGRLEELCRRHPAVWEIIEPHVTPPVEPTPQSGPDKPKKKKEEEEGKEEPTMTTIPVSSEKATAAGKPTLETWLVALREGVTGCLGILIVLTTLLLLLTTFILLLLRPGAEFTPLRDMLLILNGMTGAVLGYYFGRMPAEARANQADKARASAEQQAADEATRVAVVHAGLRNLQAEVVQRTRRTRGVKDIEVAQLDDLQDKIQQLLDQTSG